MTDSRLQLDHLVIAARTLEEGAQFVAAKFGVETAPGGTHPSMRTHNRLLNLWGGAYLEVIAIDPAAPAVDAPRPRLFALDDPAQQQRIAEHGPQLVHWVARVARPKSLTRWREQYPERIAPVAAMSRGANTWGLTVPDDGAFPAWQGAGQGVLPSLIQWDTPLLPSDVLPPSGIALRSLSGFHPDAARIAEQLAWLGAAHLMHIEATAGTPVLVAEFDLPDGSTLTLGESAEQAQAREEEALQAAKRRRAKKPDTQAPQQLDLPGTPQQDI
ncbi:VOC family protein [Caballeronia sp. LZ035]|uniref:VOC family protein n=1 Tax=Caballeronia sp. LZ035 TaxID=3038568 RepID=UPI00285CEFC4|nr:VOC family protein [Caballeronia sp. LZ035]MDR5756535.1 VOC family protein [Caballeronia sp. LZ035]